MLARQNHRVGASSCKLAALAAEIRSHRIIQGMAGLFACWSIIRQPQKYLCRKRRTTTSSRNPDSWENNPQAPGYEHRVIAKNMSPLTLTLTGTCRPIAKINRNGPPHIRSTEASRLRRDRQAPDPPVTGPPRQMDLNPASRLVIDLPQRPRGDPCCSPVAGFRVLMTREKYVIM